MGVQRILWWISLILFVGLVVVGTFFLTATIASYPEAAAFVVGFLGFWLFANRLIFNYGEIANSAKSLIEGEKLDKENLLNRVAKNSNAAKLQKLEELSTAALLSMWYSALEPFKYVYYLGYFLVLLMAILFDLNIISSLVFAPISEALALGASIPTLIVWGLQLLSGYYLSEAIVKAVKEETEEKTSSKKA